MTVTLTDRLKAFVDYQERASAQAIADLRRLVKDVEDMENNQTILTDTISRLLLRVTELERNRIK